MFDLLVPLNRLQQLYDIKQQTQMAELLGIALNTYRDNLAKAKNSSKDKEKNTKKKEYQNALYGKFVELANKDGINLNWLFYGEVPIYKNKPQVEVFIPQDNPISSKECIPLFKDFKDFKDGKFKNIILPTAFSKGQKLNAFKVLDDTMSPNIERNSIAIVDLSKKQIKKLYVYLVEYNDTFLIKRIEIIDNAVLLRSDNNTVDTIITKMDNIKIIGQVINSIMTKKIK
jgi:phage repressor protein C with HTH and peptisase S24 domain